MATVQEKIKFMKDKLDHVRMGGGEKSIEKQHKKGKLTAEQYEQITGEAYDG